jgi:hypothetical protein
MPYSVCAIDDLEVLLQVVSVERAAPVVGGKAESPEFREWAMRSFLLNRFAEQVRAAKTLFPQALDEIYPPGLKEPPES